MGNFRISSSMRPTSLAIFPPGLCLYYVAFFSCFPLGPRLLRRRLVGRTQAVIAARDFERKKKSENREKSDWLHTKHC